MNSAGAATFVEGLPESRRAALLNLLTDEDPAVYWTVREKILSLGPEASRWLQSHTLSNDPALRRRAQEIIFYFERQKADNQFLGFCCAMVRSSTWNRLPGCLPKRAIRGSTSRGIER